MEEKYIIVRVGTFADGTHTPCYQLFERERDFNHEWFEPVTHQENSPTTMSTARERLEKLRAEER